MHSYSVALLHDVNKYFFTVVIYLYYIWQNIPFSWRADKNTVLPLSLWYFFAATAKSVSNHTSSTTTDRTVMSEFCSINTLSSKIIQFSIIFPNGQIPEDKLSDTWAALYNIDHNLESVKSIRWKIMWSERKKWETQVNYSFL